MVKSFDRLIDVLTNRSLAFHVAVMRMHGAKLDEEEFTIPEDFVWMNKATKLIVASRVIDDVRNTSEHESTKSSLLLVVVEMDNLDQQVQELKMQVQELMMWKTQNAPYIARMKAPQDRLLLRQLGTVLEKRILTKCNKAFGNLWDLNNAYKIGVTDPSIKDAYEGCLQYVLGDARDYCSASQELCEQIQFAKGDTFQEAHDDEDATEDDVCNALAASVERNPKKMENV